MYFNDEIKQLHFLSPLQTAKAVAIYAIEEHLKKSIVHSEFAQRSQLLGTETLLHHFFWTNLFEMYFLAMDIFLGFCQRIDWTPPLQLLLKNTHWAFLEVWKGITTIVPSAWEHVYVEFIQRA